MPIYQTILSHLDVGPAGAAVRFTLGLVFAVAVRHTLPGAGWVVAVGALAVALFGVKAVSAVARRGAGAMPGVKACWERRRNLARLHDSYQVRKLLWLGAGILSAGWVSGQPARWETGLGGACVVAGSAAEGWWRRKGLAVFPPEGN